MIPLPNSRTVTLLLSLTAALLWQSSAVLRVIGSISTDSFLTLSPLAGLGLATLMLLLVSLLLLTNALLSAKVKSVVESAWLALPVNLVLSFSLFIVFWAISPQVFYLYYQTLFEGLPWQLVIRDWFPFRKTLHLLLPGTINNTSSLAAGVALTMLLMQAFLIQFVKEPPQNT